MPRLTPDAMGNAMRRLVGGARKVADATVTVTGETNPDVSIDEEIGSTTPVDGPPEETER